MNPPSRYWRGSTRRAPTGPSRTPCPRRRPTAGQEAADRRSGSSRPPRRIGAAARERATGRRQADRGRTSRGPAQNAPAPSRSGLFGGAAPDAGHGPEGLSRQSRRPMPSCPVWARVIVPAPSDLTVRLAFTSPKGGVGKTTLTATLGRRPPSARLASSGDRFRPPERVAAEFRADRKSCPAWPTTSRRRRLDELVVETPSGSSDPLRWFRPISAAVSSVQAHIEENPGWIGRRSSRSR